MYANLADDVISSHDYDSGPLFLYMALQNIHGPRETDEDFYDLWRQEDYVRRRQISAMIYSMDLTMAGVKQSLADAGVLDNTIVVFTSDNGGQANTGASNWPLRGGKDTWWEGGMRVPSFVYSPMFEGEDYEGTVNDW